MKKSAVVSPALCKHAESSAHLACICNAHTDFVYFNKAWLHYRKTPLPEECARSAHDFVHTDDVETFLADLSRQSQQHEPVLTWCRLRDATGNYGWFRFVVSPLHSNKGEYTGCIAYGQDVSFRKQQEELARKFTAVMASIEAGIIIKDRAGRILDWSVGAQNIMGYTKQDVLGHTSALYTHKPNARLIDEISVALARGEHTAFINTEVLHKQGHVIFCSTSFAPFLGEGGAVEGSVVIFHDVTAKKQAEEQRQQAEAALREALLAAESASKMKSAFVANMSHEIRTPLNGVVGFAELALDEAGLPDVVKSHLHNIKVSAHGLLEIINNILDISKIEAGKIDLEKIPFHLHDDILHVCETIIGEKAKEKGIILYLYSEPVVHKKCIGDPTRLRQILLNLLSNAIKFTNVGIVKLMLSMEEHDTSSCTIYFEIKDSGIGMTPSQLECIFAPFTQADSSTTRKFGGTGLGLTITKNLIELMGSTLKVESSPGIGSKFSFALTFDTIADDSPSPAVHVPAQTHTHVKPQFCGEVLVCEDNSINQQVIREHLRKVGLRPTVSPNGKLGVEQAKIRMREGRPFDLIFMDIQMPVMDGLEATQKLHALGSTSPIIALTANAMATDREKCLKHGMVDYLAKPFKAYELWDCLSRNLPAIPPAANTAPPPKPAKKEKPSPKAPAPSACVVLDRKLGIENAAGDPALYQRLLLNFVTDHTNIATRLCEALNAGNSTLAHRMAHTLKSVAATIGANVLAHIACEVETALANGDTATALLAINSLNTALNAVLHELFPLQNKTHTQQCTHKVDTAKAKALLNTIEPLLGDAALESLEYLDDVRATLLPMGELGQELVRQIDDYDFEPALATLQKLKRVLEVQDA